MQKPTLQTILISILIIVALFASCYLPYKFKQLSNDFLDQTNQYGELLKQINDLQKEVRELKNEDGEVDELEDWKIYNNPETDFTFKYPNDWEITDDYFYETATGIKVNQKTIILQKIGNEDLNDWIRINPRQFQFDIGKCVGNICTYSKNVDILNVLDKVAESFKKIKTTECEKWREECSKEGESRCGPCGCRSCCLELISRDINHPWKTENNEIVCSEDMVMYICVKCGDNICGKGENWCICPEDCPKPDLKDLEFKKIEI